MPEAVVDSSVFAAILFGEPEMEQALALIQGHSLLAPDLLPYEIANIAVTKARRGPNPVGEVVARFAEFAELGVEVVPVVGFEVLRLAVDEKLTAYDASYLWLAMARKVRLFTFDRQLAAAAVRRLTPRV